MLFISDDSILINKREEKDIWQGLNELPLIEGEFDSEELLFKSDAWKTSFKKIKPTLTGITKRKKHLLSHQVIHPVFYEMEIGKKEMTLLEQKFKRISTREIKEYAFPVLLGSYFDLKFSPDNNS